MRQQNIDGGFGFGVRGGGSDIDDTAAAVQAIVDAAGAGRSVLGRATAFLARFQNLDGGFPQQAGGVSNAQSTAWAVQALIAAGRDPSATRRAGSRSPVAYLQSLIAPDGSVRYSRTGAQTPVWVTAQALTAFAGRPFPIAPARAGAARFSSSATAAADRRRAASARASSTKASVSVHGRPYTRPARSAAVEAGLGASAVIRAVRSLLGTDGVSMPW